MTSRKPDAKDKGGRPPNVNTKMMEAELAPILDRLAAIEAGASAEVVSGGHVPLSRGHFFLHLMTGMCIHRGEAAFNPHFLDTIRNNADDFYEAYCQIVAESHEVQSTTKQLLDDAQERLRVISREKQDLADRIAEMDAEQAALLADTGLEEATEDEAVEAAQEA